MPCELNEHILQKCNHGKSCHLPITHSTIEEAIKLTAFVLWPATPVAKLGRISLPTRLTNACEATQHASVSSAPLSPPHGRPSLACDHDSFIRTIQAR